MKVFSQGFLGKRRLKKEWDGWTQMRLRGLNTPEPLFYGKTEQGENAVVVEQIVDSEIVLDVLQNTSEKTQKVQMLLTVCGELAKQHEKGILQKDMHLGNFLLRGKDIIALDPGQMKFFKQPLAKKKSLSQLAMLLCYLPDEESESISRLCDAYFKARGWRIEKSDKITILAQIRKHRKNAIKKGLRKSMRTSRRHLRITTARYKAVLCRAFCDGTNPLDLIEQIDTLMDDGKVMKQGNACYVSRTKWNDRDIVIKRYNHRGLFYSLRHSFLRSRAHRGWLHGHRLGILEIATPKPVAFIELYKGLVLWQSYLVTDYVEGPRFGQLLEDDRIEQRIRNETRENICKTIGKLALYHITHGDLKHTNILITDEGPVLTDLDGMIVHWWDWTCRRRQARDLESFNRKRNHS